MFFKQTIDIYLEHFSIKTVYIFNLKNLKKLVLFLYKIQYELFHHFYDVLQKYYRTAVVVCKM